MKASTLVASLALLLPPSASAVANIQVKFVESAPKDWFEIHPIGGIFDGNNTAVVNLTGCV